MRVADVQACCVPRWNEPSSIERELAPQKIYNIKYFLIHFEYFVTKKYKYNRWHQMEDNLLNSTWSKNCGIETLNLKSDLSLGSENMIEC